MQFNLEDLNPRACDIEVEIGGETKKFRLRKFNLLAQIWVRREFGSDKTWNEALDHKSQINIETNQAAYLEALCKTIHYLMEDKSQFKTWEEFAVEVGTGPMELVNLGRALLVTIGLSQPIVDKAVGDAKKKLKGSGKKKKTPDGT